MKIFGKLVLGVFSFIPIVFFGLFFASILASVIRQTPDIGESLFGISFERIIPLAMVTAIVLLLLMLFYTVILARRPDLEVVEKVGVPLGIFFTNGIVLPLVWWLYIWRESNLAAAGRREKQPGHVEEDSTGYAS